MRCLETPIKHDAQVFDMASKTIHASLVIRGYRFSALNSHEITYVKNIQNERNLLSFIVVSHVGEKLVESFAANIISCFHSPKTGEKEFIKVAAREYS